MYNKNKVDKATRQIITGYMRKYEYYRKWRNDERDRINYLRASNLERRAGSSKIGDPTGESAARLEEIDNNYRSVIVKVLERAREEIGAGLEMMEDQKRAFRLSVWLSCMEPKKYTYEKLYARYLFPVSRTDFFRHKNQFFSAVKKYLDL